MKIFFVQFFCVFLPPLLNIFCFFYFLSFIESMFARNVPLLSLIFLKRSLVFPILLFSSISLHWSLRKAFLSFLAILWNSAFKWEYLSFSPLLFASLLFTAICKASSDNHFAFLHFWTTQSRRSAPAATDRAEAQPWGATPCPRSGVATESARLQQRSSGSPEKLPHVQGQRQRPRGTTRPQRSGVPPERSYPTFKEQLLRGHRRAKRSYSMFMSKVRRCLYSPTAAAFCIPGNLPWDNASFI